jgi:hypothetical protein
LAQAQVGCGEGGELQAACCFILVGGGARFDDEQARFGAEVSITLFFPSPMALKNGRALSDKEPELQWRRQRSLRGTGQPWKEVRQASEVDGGGERTACVGYVRSREEETTTMTK